MKSIQEIFKEINEIKSTQAMFDAVEKLKNKREVILYALENSRYQFHWSYLAKKHKIPERDWPAQINKF